MYVATVPNRNSPPAILLRESTANTARSRPAPANITHLGAAKSALRCALAGTGPAAARPR
jgi:hypothetical protein